MTLHTMRFVGSSMMLLGGIMLFGVRSRWGLRDLPVWAGIVLVFAGISAIVCAILGYWGANMVDFAFIRVNYLRFFLAGIVAGCLITLFISGEMTRFRCKSKQHPNQPPDGTR